MISDMAVHTASNRPRNDVSTRCVVAGAGWNVSRSAELATAPDSISATRWRRLGQIIVDGGSNSASVRVNHRWEQSY